VKSILIRTDKQVAFDSQRQVKYKWRNREPCSTSQCHADK